MTNTNLTPFQQEIYKSAENWRKCYWHVQESKYYEDQFLELLSRAVDGTTLNQLASQPTEIQNSWVEDYFGGNTLDAYESGVSDGKILLAKELMK